MVAMRPGRHLKTSRLSGRFYFILYFIKKEGNMSIGIPEIILIVVVVLLLFGAKRIPELARSLGKAQNEYKKAKDALKEEAEDLQKTVEKAAEAEDKK